MHTRSSGFALVVCLAASASAQVLNEIRFDEPGVDNDEYFEISGAPGASMAMQKAFAIASVYIASTTRYTQR